MTIKLKNGDRFTFLPKGDQLHLYINESYKGKVRILRFDMNNVHVECTLNSSKSVYFYNGNGIKEIR